MKLQLRIQVLKRPPVESADAEGARLVELLRSAINRQAAPLVAVVVRRERTELVSLQAVWKAKVPIPRFLGALTRSTAAEVSLPEAVGVMGQMRVRRGRRGAPADAGVPSAHVFLEWPDNRWWHHQGLLDVDGQLLPDTETLRRADDGDSLPRGLGRWWSWGRRTGVSLDLGRLGPDETPIESDHPLVH